MEQNNLQVKLAAYVLGEATEQERLEVEAALENSAELRAERARLEATIGLVQEHMGADPESLSPEGAAVLERAAQGHSGPTGMPSMNVSTQPSVRWYQRPSLRVAASVVFAGLVWGGYQASQTEDTSAFIYDILGSDDRVASAPARKEEAELMKALDGLGYLGGQGTRPSGTSKNLAARPGGGRTGGIATVDVDSGQVEMLGALGYVADEPVLRDSEVAVALKDGEPDFLSDSTFDSTSFNDVSGAGGGAGGKFAGRMKVKGGASPGSSPRAARNEVAQEGRYRGPGDTVPASELVIAASIENVPEEVFETPPPEPAPSSIHPGALTTGSDDFFLGHGEQEMDGDLRADVRQLYGLEESQRRALEAMGYFEDVESCLEGLTGPHDRNPGAMFFRFWGDNPFEYSVLDRLSTFAADVDTASYTLARRYLLDGQLPTKAQIRTEEFVNYFDAGVAAPTEDTFAIHTELAPNRFSARSDSWMLRVVVAGKEVSEAERQPLTLTFVIDTSGSMGGGGRLELVKRSLRLLLGQLDARDSISLVAFSNEARLILPMTPANRRHLIESALGQLEPNGGTNAGKGLRLGYAQAEANLAAGTTNRVVFLSDGVANLGTTDQGRLTDEVARLRERGIYLNTIGVGMGNHNDTFLEQLADKGDGLCNYIDDDLEARRALVENFTGAFEPIARDVKIQVEFDPTQVEAYRLLGYENRAVADRDFRNDAVDAGELNAGHEVVALYELIRTGRPGGTREAPLATVRLRWKRPYTEGVASHGDEVATEGFAHVLAGDAAASFAAASPGYRKSVLVGQFAEVLRRSIHSAGDSFKDLLEESRALEGELEDEDFTEFFDLLTRSRRLLLERLARVSRWDRARDHLQRSAYLVEETRLLEARLDSLKRSYQSVPAGTDSLTERVAWIRARLDRLEASLDDDALRAMELETEVLRARLARLLALLAEEG